MSGRTKTLYEAEERPVGGVLPGSSSLVYPSRSHLYTWGGCMAWPGLSVWVCESRRPGFQLPQHPLLQILEGGVSVLKAVE